jgi:hypothetical protein
MSCHINIIVAVTSLHILPALSAALIVLGRGFDPQRFELVNQLVGVVA